VEDPVDQQVPLQVVLPEALAAVAVDMQAEQAEYRPTPMEAYPAVEVRAMWEE
jgi:hypothetical protein